MPPIEAHERERAVSPNDSPSAAARAARRATKVRVIRGGGWFAPPLSDVACVRLITVDMDGDLPFIDEHQVHVSTSAPAVWRALTTQLSGRGLGGGAALAHLLAAEPRRASGSGLAEGATLPGFKVAEAAPGRRVRLTGRHHFSRYSLIFTLVTQPDGTVLIARTLAEFPGLRGSAYRWLVIGSGAHRVLVARLLRAVRRQAEGQGVR